VDAVEELVEPVLLAPLLEAVVAVAVREPDWDDPEDIAPPCTTAGVVLLTVIFAASIYAPSGPLSLGIYQPVLSKASDVNNNRS
jgi:hypothetical protein